MSEDPASRIRETVDSVYRAESRRVFATLIRLLGDFDLAEEALHDAFSAALEQWPRDGVPTNPRAWLVSTGRFKAIDAMRRRARFGASLSDIAERLEFLGSDDESHEDGLRPGAGFEESLSRLAERFHVDAESAALSGDEGVEDDRLRLIFTCCHPALPQDAQVALTLREVCGLTTEEIAHAFLVSLPTLAQRIVRAKAKIHDARKIGRAHV